MERHFELLLVGYIGVTDWFVAGRASSIRRTRWNGQLFPAGWGISYSRVHASAGGSSRRGQPRGRGGRPMTPRDATASGYSSSRPREDTAGGCRRGSLFGWLSSMNIHRRPSVGCIVPGILIKEIGWADPTVIWWSWSRRWRMRDNRYLSAWTREERACNPWIISFGALSQASVLPTSSSWLQS